MENKILPPKAVSALVFGILSVFFCVFLDSFIIVDALEPHSHYYVRETSIFDYLFAVICFIPVIFGVIGLNKSKKGYIAVNKNPEKYRNVGMLKAARITSYVGAFSSFAVIILIWILIKVVS